MQPLLISTSDLDGGAARAAHRLHQGLLKAGVSSRMLVRTKLSQDETVIAHKPVISQLGSKLDGFPLRKYPKRDRAMFSPQWFPDAVISKVKEINPDIIHLHWFCNGYLQIESLAKFGKPIVWTLHDMWAFTGGCHYTQGCDRYNKSCGNCPLLGSSEIHDLSRRIWHRKAKSWQNLDLTIVTPSQWMADCAAASSLFKNCRIEVIPNGIDTRIYKPIDKSVAREALNLPQNKQLVLFGAGSTSGDPRKGFHHLLAALQRLEVDQWGERLDLVVFGESKPEDALPMSFKTLYLGRLNDDVSLALAYSSADLFIAPSQQDNLPNTLLEALSCGTPCLAFNIGGIPEIIEHQKNGYLANPFEIEDLTRGITWALEQSNRYQVLNTSARQKAEQAFALELQAQRYLKLYQDLLNPPSTA